MDAVRRIAPPTPLAIVASSSVVVFTAMYSYEAEIYQSFAGANYGVGGGRFCNSLKIDPPGITKLPALVGLLHTFQELALITEQVGYTFHLRIPPCQGPCFFSEHFNRE